MYSVVFSSRQQDSFSHNPLFGLLDSFENNTSEEEKSKSEFLIKFDSDDQNIPSNEKLNSYSFDIQKFVWDRHGGRGSLHETQNILYNYVRKDCKFVQLIADDFLFTRQGFVSEILEHSDTYKITGSPGMTDFNCPPGTHGYCPAFSTKVIDALGGITGPHCNADGVACCLAEKLRENYDYEIMFSPGNGTNYYIRTDTITSRYVPSDIYASMTYPPSSPELKGFYNDYWSRASESVARSMYTDQLGGVLELRRLVERGKNDA